MKAKKKDRVVVMTNSKEYENVELRDILDKTTKRKLEEMYGQITEDRMK